MIYFKVSRYVAAAMIMGMGFLMIQETVPTAVTNQMAFSGLMTGWITVLIGAVIAITESRFD
jgi:hypothetical protein